MEVMGDDDRDEGLRNGDRTRVPAEPLAEIDLGSTDASGIQVPDEAEAGEGLARKAWSAATAGESLAICGLTLGLVTLFGGYGGPVTMLMSDYSNYGPRKQMHQYGIVLAVGATISLLVSLASVYRLRSDAPGWARSVAGAGIGLAGILVLLTAAVLWRASNAPITFGS